MEIGPIIALLSGACFAGSHVFIRKGVSQTGEAFSAVPITVFIGTLLFSVILFFTAEWGKIWSLSWQGFTLLGTAGIIHFVAARLLSFSCIRLIGANKTSVIQRTNIFYAVTFGVLFLHESVTIYLVVGVLCIATGTILVGLGRGGEVSKLQGKGILFGLASAFFMGISGVLVKPAITEIGSPLAAIFISHAAASLVLAALLIRKEQREQLTQLRRVSLVPMLIASISVSVAQLLRYVAFSYSPVSVVQPLMSTIVLFVFLFSFLLNRNIEVFTWRVFVGMAATVAGTFLLFQ